MTKDFNKVKLNAKTWYKKAFGDELRKKVLDMIGTKIKSSQDAFDLNDYEDQDLQEISLGERDAIEFGFIKIGEK